MTKQIKFAFALMCGCVRARVCVRACVRVCVRACVCMCDLSLIMVKHESLLRNHTFCCYFLSSQRMGFTFKYTGVSAINRMIESSVYRLYPHFNLDIMHKTNKKPLSKYLKTSISFCIVFGEIKKINTRTYVVM